MRHGSKYAKWSELKIVNNISIVKVMYYLYIFHRTADKSVFNVYLAKFLD